MPTIFDAYAGMLRIATFQADPGIVRHRRSDGTTFQLEGRQRHFSPNRARPR